VPIARARALRDLLARYRDPLLHAASHALDAKIRLSKYHHAPKLWALQNIFAGPITFYFWPNMAIS
jgi:hypothetical protein